LIVKGVGFLNGFMKFLRLVDLLKYKLRLCGLMFDLSLDSNGRFTHYCLIADKRNGSLCMNCCARQYFYIRFSES
jgi:hypothetical protein